MYISIDSPPRIIFLNYLPNYYSTMSAKVCSLSLSMSLRRVSNSCKVSSQLTIITVEYPTLPRNRPRCPRKDEGLALSSQPRPAVSVHTCRPAHSYIGIFEDCGKVSFGLRREVAVLCWANGSGVVHNYHSCTKVRRRRRRLGGIALWVLVCLSAMCGIGGTIKLICFLSWRSEKGPQDRTWPWT